MRHNTPRYLYVMGRGHSGSTILDALLGSGKHLHSTGEIVSGMPRTEDKCSCGKKIKDCDFWNAVKNKFNEESDYSWEQAAEYIQGQAHLKSFIKTWRGRNTDNINRLKKINQSLFKAISEVAGKEVVIDSSKEFTRGLFLARYLPDGKVIHLIRNPLRILASNMLRIKEGKFKVLRYKFDAQKTAFPFILLSAAGWLVGNILGELIHLVEKKNVLRVRYEDLCERPAEELKRIEAFTGYDLTDIIRGIEESREMQIKHMIAGNRMRLNGSFIFRPSGGKQRELPLRYSLLGILITWPLMLRYGYLTRWLKRGISKRGAGSSRKEGEEESTSYNDTSVLAE